MRFLLAQDVGHMNCNDEECITQDRASLLHLIANMAPVLLSLSSLAPGKHSVALFLFYLNEALQQSIVADVIAS
jgi:hypothetical protein